MKAVLRSLIRLLPAAFRERFAAEMTTQVERDHERARSRGRLAATCFTLATALDLIRCGIAERWNPTWAGHAPPARRRGIMRTMNGWGRDLRHAARSLRRTPGFTVMAVGMLGLAIGAVTGMSSVIDTVLLDPLPYAHVDRLVYIAGSAPGSDFPPEFPVSAEFLVQYREQSQLLEDISTYNSFTSTLRAGDRVERVRMSWPTNSMYSTLGAKPILGRLPVPEDENNVAVISHRLWQSWFGGDPDVIGRAYDISGARRTVIGIMGPEFAFPNDETLLWVASEVRPEEITPGRFGQRLVARMKPGATVEEVATELTALSKRLPERFGGSANYARLIEQHRAVVRPIGDELLGEYSRPLWVLLGAAVIVLVIACANVANLFLVRAEGRQRDLAVRRAIGAGRAQLVRLQMSEAAVVASLAGGVAVALAAATLPLFVRAAPPGVPRLAQAGIGLPMLAFALAAALISALACGLLPAMRAARPDLGRLRDGGRGSTQRRHWARDALVAGQTALALVLLIGSGLLLRSFQELRSVDPGYDTKDIFTFQIAPERESLSDGPSFARFSLDFMDRLRALPGVESVGLVENVPLNEGTRGSRFRTEERSGEEDAGPLLQFTWAAGDYFRTMGIAVLSGRPFETADHTTAPGHVVISRSAANLLWPGQDPIGRRMQREDQEWWATVVGVVEDVLQDSFRDAPDPLVYYPLVGPTSDAWALSSPAYVVKTARAEQIAPEVRALVHEIAPEAPMYRVFTMEGLAADSMVQLSFTMLTLGIASSLALVLGAMGLYGVLSYLVAERTREIGVRMALGARAEQIRRMVVAQGARVLAVGIGVGIVAAVASTRALGGLLFGVQALDAATFTGMSASLVVVGLLASYVPARRASSVDPIESLRSE